MSESESRDPRREQLAEERTRAAQERTAMAAERTRSAYERTALAAERTFSAWLRTALSAIGVGVAIPGLIYVGRDIVLDEWVGLILVLLGAGMAVMAIVRYVQLEAHANGHKLPAMPIWVAAAMTTGVLAVAALATILVLAH